MTVLVYMEYVATKHISRTQQHTRGMGRLCRRHLVPLPALDFMEGFAGEPSDSGWLVAVYTEAFNP